MPKDAHRTEPLEPPGFPQISLLRVLSRVGEQWGCKQGNASLELGEFGGVVQSLGPIKIQNAALGT